MVDAEQVAEAFHEAYERLAPKYNYKTRKASAVAWSDVPEANKKLMVAVVREILPLLKQTSGADDPLVREGADDPPAGEKPALTLDHDDLFSLVPDPIAELIATICAKTNMARGRPGTICGCTCTAIGDVVRSALGKPTFRESGK